MKARTAKVMEIPEEEKRLEKQLCFAVYATAHDAGLISFVMRGLP